MGFVHVARKEGRGAGRRVGGGKWEWKVGGGMGRLGD